MRISLCLLIGLLNCSPALYGKWVSGSGWLILNKDNAFQVGDSTGVIVDTWYTTRTYDYNKKTYVEGCGPGKDSRYHDQIYFGYNKDTIPVFWYMLRPGYTIRPDALLLQGIEDSIGTLYLRSER